MSLRERIQRADAANRAGRQEYVERLYSRGWRPETQPEREDWDKLQAAFTCFALAAFLAILWVMS